MNIVNLLFTFGNVLLFFASFPTFRTVIRNRENLKDFNLFGAMLTYLGLVLFMGAYLTLSNWGSVLFASPTIITWGTIVLYMTVNRYKDGVRLTEHAHKSILSDSDGTSFEAGNDTNKVLKSIRVHENEVMRHRRHRIDTWE